jgi:hypothetical protein
MHFILSLDKKHLIIKDKKKGDEKKIEEIQM